LAEVRACLLNGIELFDCLDSLRDNERIEIATEHDNRRHELEHARAFAKACDEIAIELHDAGMKISDVTEVRVTRTEVIDDEVDASSTHFREDALAKTEMRERNALRDLEVDVFGVLEDRVIRLNDEFLVQLGGMNVEKERMPWTPFDRHLANDASELTSACMLHRRSEEAHRALELR
jgi:hypothetical protein